MQLTHIVDEQSKAAAELVQAKFNIFLRMTMLNRIS